MEDYYKILGVDKTSGDEDIKKAYRRLAMKHHPDRGGDQAQFQKIQEAYNTLGDPEKRQAYDNPAPQGFFGGNDGFPGGFHFSTNGMPPGFENFFAGAFGEHPFFNRGRPKNQNLNIQTTITLEEAHSGKDLMATLRLPSGREQIVEIKIPAGVGDGVTLRLSGMGDDSIPNITRGDIYLTINVQEHTKFRRNGDDLITDIEISCVDAMLGKTVMVTTIDNKILEMIISPGTQHGQLMAAAGYGMPKISNNRFKGRLLVNILVRVPENLTEAQKQILKQYFT